MVGDKLGLDKEGELFIWVGMSTRTPIHQKFNVQLPTQIVGIFMLLIENDKVIVVKYAVWRKEWQWWGISWDWIRKVSYLYGLV